MPETAPELAFADFETRSPADLTACGAYSYARHPFTDCVVLAHALANGSAGIWSPKWAWPYPQNEPVELFQHILHGGYVVAWNANFDRQIWNNVMVAKYGWPACPLEQWLCAMAQAEANNLPGALEKACETLGTPFQKDKQGKKLINQLSMGAKADWSDSFSDNSNGRVSPMARFRKYGRTDVEAMRDVWQSVRPLTMDEWDEYHASETINDRGIAVDVEFATAAAEFAVAERTDLNAQLLELTGDPELTVTNHVRKAKYLHTLLDPSPELQEAVSRPPKDDTPDRPRYSADRPTREFILDALAQPEFAKHFHGDYLPMVQTFLELIEAGNSAAVNKFKAIVNTQYGGRIYGQYSFNGGGQTGRFSARGVQIHNLIRAPLNPTDPNAALDAIDAIIAGADSDRLQKDYGHTISRLLARLIRPTFIAAEGKTLVWGDWAAIEGRILPWLANTPLAEEKLDLYRQDISPYVVNACTTFDVPPDKVTKDQRQIGKVQELAGQFGGSVGALAVMCRSYGIVIPEDQRQPLINHWRSTNRWATAFWEVLKGAAFAAYASPGQWFRAGRVQYLYHPGYMHGTLFCQLPDQRIIVYPQFRRERYRDEETGKLRFRTDYVRGFGSGSARVKLWHGTLAENITQATAASLLRGSLVELQDDAVLHSQDEIVLEVPEDTVPEASDRLESAMLFIPEWAEGLPLKVELEHGPFYTK